MEIDVLSYVVARLWAMRKIYALSDVIYALHGWQGRNIHSQLSSCVVWPTRKIYSLSFVIIMRYMAREEETYLGNYRAYNLHLTA